MEQDDIRILVVDDHFIIRSGLTASLNAEPDMQVVAEASDGGEALRLYRECLPDLVIMDARLPGMSGTETTAALMRESREVRVLMLSAHCGDEEVYQALQSGARGYLGKSVVREELLTAIREVAAGRRYLDAEVTQSLARRLSQQSLTTREVEVLALLVEGLSNKEIAAKLHLAEITVKQHVSHVLEKLEVADRTQAATAALQRGIVRLL